MRAGVEASAKLAEAFRRDLVIILQRVAEIVQAVTQAVDGFGGDSAEAAELDFIQLPEGQGGDQIAENGNGAVGGYGVGGRHD